MRFRSHSIPLVILAMLAGAFALGSLILPGGALAVQQPTPPPTNTPRPAPPATNTPRPIDPSPTSAPTETPLPTATEPVFLPTPTLYYPPDVPVRQPPATAIPSPMPRLRSLDASGAPYELLNVLLIGHDGNVIPDDPNFHTDTLIVVSINRNTNTVSMISLPRDLFVHIPNWGMARLNQAYWYGEAIGWEGGGWGMLRQVVLYNFGIELHYYAMADFEGFEQVVDTLGGVTIAVDCPIQDMKCTGPACTDGIPGNETDADYELYTLPVGVYEMGGEQALWYARSRKNTIDFDRGRRQQQLLRAIWAKSLDAGLIPQIPDLWSQMTSIVETNMPVNAVLPLIPLALSISPNDIENHFFRKNIETVAWTDPANGANVQLPNPDGGMLRLIEDFLAPPTQNRLRLEDARIAVENGTTNEGWDLVAADRLIWEGFAPSIIGQAAQTDVARTMIYDYTGSSKGSSLGQLTALLNIRPENVIIEPDPNRTVDFRIVLGADYNSCVGRQWVEPRPTGEAGGS